MGRSVKTIYFRGGAPSKGSTLSREYGKSFEENAILKMVCAQ